MMSSSDSYGVGPMIYLLRDIESKVRSELEVIIENNYKYWVEAFCPKYVSCNLSRDILSNISPIIECWLDDLKRILGSNKFKVVHSNSGFDSELNGQLAFLNNFFAGSGSGVSKLFSLPPLPWSVDLLIKFGKLWEVAAFTVIENSLLSDEKSFRVIRDWVSEIIKKNIFQSIRLGVFYKSLTNFAQDDDSSLKSKNVYKFVNSRIIPILMRAWSRKFNNKDFYKRDFLEILKLNLSLSKPDYNKGDCNFFVPLGSRLERGLVKFLYDLADIKLENNLGADIDMSINGYMGADIDADIDSDIDISNYDYYIENINKQVAIIKSEYYIFYGSYKEQRRKEMQSVFLMLKKNLKLGDVSIDNGLL